MVREIRIYFEGDAALRPGFHGFFHTVREAARGRGMGFQLVACGGDAIRDFCIALRTHPEATNVLLIDSEGPYDDNLIAQIQQRSDWKPPTAVKVNDDQIHFMVEVMEAWFLADREVLETYYGSDFRPQRLPANPNVEAVPKDAVLGRLHEATKGTAKGPYHKTRHAPQILARLNVEAVRGKAPACDRLLGYIEQFVH